MQAQTPSGLNPLFSLQRPADCNLLDLFQTLELITSLLSQKRGEITMRGNMGSLESGRSTSHPSRNKADFLKERLLNLGPSMWCRTHQNMLPPLGASWCLTYRKYSSNWEYGGKNSHRALPQKDALQIMSARDPFNVPKFWYWKTYF